MRTMVTSFVVALGALGIAAVVTACGASRGADAPFDAAADIAIAPADASEVKYDAGEAGVFDAGDFCAPTPVTTLSLRWPAPIPRRAVCTEQEIYSVQNCFIAPQLSGTACPTILDGGVSAECIECAVSRSTDPTAGALLIEGDYARIDVGGCVYAAGGDLKCAQAIELEAQCIGLACGPCRAAGNDAFESCAAEARRSEPKCAPAVYARDTCLKLAPLPAVCAPGPDFYRSAHDVAMFWCGPGAADAGAD